MHHEQAACVACVQHVKSSHALPLPCILGAVERKNNKALGIEKMQRPVPGSLERWLLRSLRGGAGATAPNYRFFAKKHLFRIT